MLRRICQHCFTKKITLAKWQFNLYGLIVFSLGAISGIYFLAGGLITQVFAAASPWIQTNWSGGQGSSTSTQYASVTDLATATEGQVSMGLISGWTSDYQNWKYRKKITFNNTLANIGVATENLVNFPVLVKLDSGTDIDYSKTQDNGQDIRFSDSDGTILNYEIEKWDETGTSTVWVKVPQIDTNSSTDHIYMYYGNQGVEDGQTTTGVWNDGYVGVWHFKEGSGATVVDSKGNYNGTLQFTSNWAAGQIGNSYNFNGTSDGLIIPDNNAFDLADFTIEAWAKPNSPISWAPVVYKGTAATANYQFGSGGSGTSFAIDFGGPAWHGLDVAGAFTNSAWNYYVATLNTTTDDQILYKNGASVGSNLNQTSDPVTYANSSNLAIGTMADLSSYYRGYIDEVRISNIARSAAWIAATYKSQADALATFETEQTRYPANGVLVSNIFDADYPSNWGNLTVTSAGSGSVTTKVRTSNSATMEGATDWSSCAAKTSGDDLSGGCVTDTHRYVQYQITLEPSAGESPVVQEVSVAFTASDATPPVTNASAITMATAASGGRSITSNNWNNSSGPYFSWANGADNEGGVGLKGYCLYLGTDSGGNPASAKGVLGVSPVDTTGSTCQFIVAGTNVNLATAGYLGTGLASGTTYYFRVKAIDLANNIFDGAAAQFQFQHDGTEPTNVAYLSMPSGSFSNVEDMSFSWPASTSSSGAADSGGSTLLGYQYQIGGIQGLWKGNTTLSRCGFDYIPATETTYNLTTLADGGVVDEPGNYVVYFRSVDSACNSSSAATYRTGNLSYGGAAPAFGGDASVTVTPASSTENLYALSWPAATAEDGSHVAGYYYMVNTSPPGTYATLVGNATTYMSNSTATSVSLGALPNVNKGANTVYVVAIDDAQTPNYSPSNFISGTFTLDSTDPNNVDSLVATDSSIKASAQWNVTLTWTAPAYQGAGNLTYLIFRSSDGESFSQVGSTTGLSYVDNTPASRQYFYKVYTQDGADALSSGTNAVSITPTGRYTSAASLESGPTASSTTTKRATITWSTSRGSDSKIQYGTTSGVYSADEVSNSAQVTSHTVNLNNLSAGTTYYYKAKWADEDGNMGTSEEKSFKTEAAPTITDPKAKTISLTSAVVEYTATGASKVKIYYGESTAFGGSKEIYTSTSATTYTTELSGLKDGTKYFYKINTFDAETSEYEGNVLTFETLPRPKIANVRVQQVANTAQSTLLVTWTSNTEISSIVTYYPQGEAGQARDEVSVTMVKGEHRMIVRGLLPQTNYEIVVKGRDKVGNEAESDLQRVTTATDTRPPQITGMKVQGTNIPPVASTAQEQKAQLVVTWNTDEPATSQVEYGEGTGSTYAQKTQEDGNLKTNHLVVISGLTPSKVYHLRAITKDKVNNETSSVDVVSITPKATENALNLVIQNLTEAFGFLSKLKE